MKQRIKRFLLLLLTGLLFFPGSVWSAIENSAELPVVKIVYARDIDDLPFYVGVEEGFFEQEGVKVELVFIKGEQNALAGVMKNDVQAANISVESLYKLADKEVPVKVVTWLGQAHEGTKCGIHVGVNTPYQTFSDLKGARIATSGNLMPKTMLTHAVHLGGLELKDLRPIYGGRPDNPMQHEAALRAGAVDGFIV
ncbi:MAG: ABC transporter substrate-binding protein [Desulfofustis sp.]|jgi:ABC-type nitrate/sulfonate/bicarbonate transport system substrate-binding protein|nr:ABC transporter substrate-binding protein [Desulfofustis sp.]